MATTKRKFSKDQLILFVEINIASAIDVFTAAFDPRYEDGSNDDQWREDRKHQPLNPQEVINQAIIQLGWNLSILFAQFHDDGIGVSDALSVIDLDTTLDQWATKWATGEIGIMPGNNRFNVPDAHALATEWVTKTFDEPGESFNDVHEPIRSR